VHPPWIESATLFRQKYPIIPSLPQAWLSHVLLGMDRTDDDDDEDGADDDNNEDGPNDDDDDDHDDKEDDDDDDIAKIRYPITDLTTTASNKA